MFQYLIKSCIRLCSAWVWCSNGLVMTTTPAAAVLVRCPPPPLGVLISRGSALAADTLPDADEDVAMTCRWRRYSSLTASTECSCFRISMSKFFSNQSLINCEKVNEWDWPAGSHLLVIANELQLTSIFCRALSVLNVLHKRLHSPLFVNVI